MDKEADRRPDGYQMQESSAVACDAIAYLSGVNYGSVVKVLAAIDAISEYTGESITSLVDYADAPTESVRPNDPAHDFRRQQTTDLVYRIVDSGLASKYAVLAQRLRSL